MSCSPANTTSASLLACLLIRTLLLLFGRAAGLVTFFLMYNVTCYGRRRLWRGPHWVDALNQVRLDPAGGALECIDTMRQ